MAFRPVASGVPELLARLEALPQGRMAVDDLPPVREEIIDAYLVELGTASTSV